MKFKNFNFKKRILSNRLMQLIIIVCGLFIFSSLTSNGLKGPDKKSENTGTKAMLPPPITASDYSGLLSLRNLLTYYDTVNQKNVAVEFTDTKISLTELIPFYNGMAHNNFSWGLRFYPSYNSGNKNISLIMSVSKNNGSASEKAFYLLSDTNYNSSNHLLLSDTLAGSGSAASALFENYFQEVKIGLATQTKSSDTFKISRFYSYTEFLHFFSANIPDFNPADPGTYSDYSLGVEFGYVNNAMSTDFFSRYGELVPAGSKENYIGYTVLLSIYKNGKQLLDPSANYGANNYSNAIMEVGCPCPPMCDSTK